MRFLIIVLCLLSEKYFTHEYQNLRRSWLRLYTEKLQALIPSSIYKQTSLSPYIISLASLLSIALIFKFVSHFTLGLVLNFFFELLVCYMCLGAQNLFYTEDDSTNLKTNQYIEAINREVLGLLLWFFVLGPFGALVYRVTNYFSSLSSHDEQLKNIQSILDWLPVRVTALLFLMVGSFQPGFTYLLQNMAQKPEFNHKLLIHTARNALGVNEKQAVEPIALENMYTHACLLFVFILAIFVIGTII